MTKSKHLQDFFLVLKDAQLAEITVLYEWKLI